MRTMLMGSSAWLVAGITALCATATGGCATMFTGSVQQMTVSSQPPGARVFIDGAYTGVTPMTLMLKTERDHTVTLQHEGYRDTVSPVIREFNPVAVLNLFGLVCWVVDIATGAIWRFPPNAIYVALLPLGPPGTYPPPPVYVPPGTPPPGYQPPPGMVPPAPPGSGAPLPYSPPPQPPPVPSSPPN
jgi:PEGA domain-containing protein